MASAPAPESVEGLVAEIGLWRHGTEGNDLDGALYRRSKAIFLALCERPEVERAPAVRAACGGDERLAARALDLLRADGCTCIPAEGDPLLGDGASGVAEAAGRDAHGDGEGIAEAAGRDLPLPARIGPYAVRRRLGDGGMGVDGEAEQPGTRRKVAV